MNQIIKKAAHAVYDIRYHLIWATKYRKPVLIGQDAFKIRALIRQICNQLNIDILKGNVKTDHISLIISAPPNISVSMLVGTIKGKVANTIFRESDQLRKIYPQRHLWARGYYVSTNIHLPQETAFKYMDIELDQDTL